MCKVGCEGWREKVKWGKMSTRGGEEYEVKEAVRERWMEQRDGGKW